MKKFNIILFALLTISSAKAQWLPQTSNTTNNLNSVHFTDANTGYAVGDGGTILKSIDGGNKWDTLSSGTTANLASVHFPGIDTGYVVGSDSTILKTIDGGIHWIDQSSAGNSGCYNEWLCSVFFTNTDTGYAAGMMYYINPIIIGGGVLLKTVNGGTDWTICYTGGTWSSFSSLYFTNENIGYMINGGGLEKTVNAGLEWTWIGVSIHARSLSFLGVDTGYIVGWHNAGVFGEPNIGKTINGGEDWTYQNTGISDSLNSVIFTNSENGYAVGKSGLIMNTSNSGADWTIQNSGTAMNLNSVYFVDDNIGYAVGDSGTILKTTNGGFPVGINDNGSTIESLKIYPTAASKTITIETTAMPEKNICLSLFNLNGQEIINRLITEQRTLVDISGLPQGIYFVRVKDDKTVQAGKIIKQ